MSGYLYFNTTGVKSIDSIANKITQAGNCYHHTEFWGEESDDGKSPIDHIQDAIDDAAKVEAELLEHLKCHLSKLSEAGVRNQKMKDSEALIARLEK